MQKYWPRANHHDCARDRSDTEGGSPAGGRNILFARSTGRIHQFTQFGSFQSGFATGRMISRRKSENSRSRHVTLYSTCTWPTTPVNQVNLSFFSLH